MDAIEKELLDFIKTKPKKTEDRQDYLHAIVVAISKVADKNPDGFDELSEEAANWYSEAVEAHNNKDDVPDFEADAEADADGADADADPNDDEDETDEDEKVTSDGEQADEADEVVDDEVDADAAEEAEAEADNEAKEAAASKAKKKAAKGKAPAKKGKAAPAEKPAKADKSEKAEKPKKPSPREYTTFEKDRYGVTLGTKTHDAVLMYEKGCTCGDVAKALDGKFYNILKTLAKQGHRVERSEGGVMTLTHKDDVGKAPKKPGKKGSKK